MQVLDAAILVELFCLTTLFVLAMRIESEVKNYNLILINQQINILLM